MTIEVPTPSADLIAQIETATIQTDQAEAAAIAAIRERFASYAKHNGFIMIADYDKSASNYSVDRNAHYERDGKRVRGLLADDSFKKDHTDQNRGTRSGSRVYLTEYGEWLQIVRVGQWTQWQGEAQWWYTDAASASAIEVDTEDYEGREEGEIRILTDAEVAEQYDLDHILGALSTAMAEMCKKLPARYARLKQRAELAARVIAAATEPNKDLREWEGR